MIYTCGHDNVNRIREFFAPGLCNGLCNRSEEETKVQ
jgi:hypothetical protein